MGLLTRIAILVRAAIVRMWRAAVGSTNAASLAQPDEQPTQKLADDREECGCPKITYKMIYAITSTPQAHTVHAADSSCCRTQGTNMVEGGIDVRMFFERYKRRAIRAQEEFAVAGYWAVLYANGVKIDYYGEEQDLVVASLIRD